MVEQFVIWGKPPKAEYEDLLISEHAGIASYAAAQKACAVLENEHGCAALRIQKLEPLGDAGELAAMFRGVVN